MVVVHDGRGVLPVWGLLLLLLLLLMLMLHRHRRRVVMLMLLRRCWWRIGIILGRGHCEGVLMVGLVPVLLLLALVLARVRRRRCCIGVGIGVLRGLWGPWRWLHDGRRRQEEEARLLRNRLNVG